MSRAELGVRTIQVAVVAPAMLAWGLERMIHSAHPRFELAGSADTLANARHFLQQGNVDVVALDIDGGYDNDAVVAMRTWTQAHLVVLTSSRDEAALDEAMVNG